MSTRARSACDECGWASKWTDSEARADYAYRRHSCAKQRRDAARRRRVAKRKAASGPVRGCEHKIARHAHGTKAAYSLDRCRCRACRDAVSTYERDRERKIMYGTWSAYVDAQPARDHIAALSAAGVGWKRAADLAGLSPSTVWKVVYPHRGHGPATRCRPGTLAAILAVEINERALRPGAVVDPTGAARRLQALVAVGWSQSKLAARLGMLPSNIGPLVHGLRKITAGTARAVRALYDELWNQPPPQAGHRDKIAASRARRQGADQGWAKPLAWDDDTIDNPVAWPYFEDESYGPDPRIDFDDLEFLIDQGETWQTLPGRLGVERASIWTALQRKGRRDLIARLDRERAA